MKQNNYDVQMMYTEDDLKKIQIKPNLYIQKYGAAGIFHLFKEIVQNCIDELIDPLFKLFLQMLKEKIKARIKITYDRLIDRVTIEDCGRGIPEESYAIDIACTKLQAGSKFFRDQGGRSSGEFGVGLTVVNALSSEFTLDTYRMDYHHKIVFKDGVKVEDIKEPTKKNGKKHGTITSFIANQKYLGAGAHLPLDMCIEWLEMISYQVPDGLEFYIEEYEGINLIKSLTIKKKPFSKLIERFIPDDSQIGFGPVSFSTTGQLEEEITKQIVDKNGKIREKKEKKTKDISLEFAFAYDTSTLDSTYESFCNFTKTDEGGVHLDSVEDVICQYLVKQTTANMTDRQKQEYPIIRPDIKTGLKLVVNLSTDVQVDFMGNAKNKIQNEALKPVLKEIAKNAIEEYFINNQGKLAQISKIIIANAKARIDVQKAKAAVIKGKTTRFDDFTIANFIPCNNTKPSDYRELFLIEGRKSAAGSVVDGRDSNCQAVFGFRGQTLNPYKTTFEKFMQNEEWRDYIRVIRCGIRPVRIERLWYNKIIIATDADIDGYGIGLSIASTHALYLPEIVTGGYLYKCYPPLYAIDNNDNPFVRSKGELVELYMKIVIKRYKIRVAGRGALISDYFNKDEFWVFLYDTIDYRRMLVSLEDFFKVPAKLIEAVAASLTLNGGIDMSGGTINLVPGILDNPKFVRNFMQELQRIFPESTLDKDALRSIADGRRCSIRINYRFAKKIENLIPVFQKYGYLIGVKEQGVEDRVMTILDFLDDTYHLTPKIITRFKGLGEANADQLWDTTLNPANRILVQLTMENIERDMEIFRKLKSGRATYMRQRKQMVESYKISVDDLDN